ncbi:MFS general substrate transporter [Trametes maxima]|nr:MFS general substrate transporter [Trametes maxima]
MTETDPVPLSPTEEKVTIEIMNEVVAAESVVSDELPLPPVLTAEEERRLWRKIDVRLIPIATILYLVSYVDRGNIGNAKLQGLITQLDLSGQRYNIALTMYYLSYSIFNVPANLVLKKFRPSRWLPGLTLAWGIVAALMGLVKTYPQLVIVRVLLGIAESGMSPGIYYLLSLWYPRHMLQWRIGLFWGGATFSGAFTGLLAYGISFMSGKAGLLGWSWIFIIEGLVTVAVALVAFIVFVDLPETATFLTPKERSFVIHRLKNNMSSAGEEEDFKWSHIPGALLDWKIVVVCIANIGVAGPLYGISLFLPSIINGFGYTPAISQLLTVPPYIIATIIVVITSTYSDRIKMRSPFVLAGLALAFVGFAINVSNASNGVKYFGTYLVVIGEYETAPMIITWLGNNAVGHYKRGLGIGMIVMFGNLGGIISSNVYHAQDAPRYVRGHIAEMAQVAMSLALVAITALVYVRRNTRRDVAQREMEEKGMVRELTTEEVERKMGDRAPTFRYTL